MTPTAVVTRYANALADVVMGPSADVQGGMQPGDAAAQLRAFAETVHGSHDLRNALISPTVSLARKRAVITLLTDKLGASRLVRNFLLVLSDHRRLDALMDVASRFEAILDERLGYVRAEITSAQGLRPEQQDALVEKITQMTMKKVRPSYSIDPELVGGVMVGVGSKVYDGSVRGQLAAIGKKLAAIR